MDKKLFSLISIRTLEKITDSIGLSLLLFRYSVIPVHSNVLKSEYCSLIGFNG